LIVVLTILIQAEYSLEMDNAFFIGITAAICTTISFLPQVIKTVKTRHTKDLSLGMLSLLVFGVFLWAIYGTMIKAAPVIASNLVTLVLVSIILLMKIKHG
jgi:MtN3 and saliva related transmembrane protein